jgi:hypothetical protein
MEQNEHAYVHVQQAGAEIAVAQAMGWLIDRAAAVTGASILPDGVHVYWSPDPDSALRVPLDAPDDDVYILVTGTAPTYCIHGWTYGRQAKRPEYLRHDK